jgi:hypothetical protein
MLTVFSYCDSFAPTLNDILDIQCDLISDPYSQFASNFIIRIYTRPAFSSIDNNFNPNDTFYVTIVNQTDLDEGNIKFDIFDQVKEGNMYKRRITYESDNGEHLNHYIALKKLPKNVTDNTIQAEVVIRLTELEQKQPQQPLYSPLDIQNDFDNDHDHDQNQNQEQDQYQEQPQLIDSTNEPETVEELKEQLYKLSQSSDYINNKNNINFYKKIGMACLFVIVLYIIFRKK